MNATEEDGGGENGGRDAALAKVEVAVLAVVLALALVSNGLVLVALLR